MAVYCFDEVCTHITYSSLFIAIIIHDALNYAYHNVSLEYLCFFFIILFCFVSCVFAPLFCQSECWLGGGEYDASFTGHALHTTDGGNTFVDNQLPGYYFNDFSFTSRSSGWATAFNALQQSSLLQFSR